MILIITHDSADFDAIASSSLLGKVFPNSYILKPMSFEEPVLNFLKKNPLSIPFVNRKDLKNWNIEKIIFSDCDVNNELLEHLHLKNIPIEVFDHHSTKGFGSNVSLVLSLFKNKLKNINREEALLSLLGIYQDTGNLTYESTKPADFSASSFFLQFKPQIHRIPYYIKLFEIDIKGISIINEIIENGVIIGPRYFQIMVSHYNSSMYYFGHSLLLNHLINLLNLKGILVLFIFKNKTFLTGRSSTNNIDINTILNKIKKGKGHVMASTRILKKGNEHDIEREIKNIVSEFIFTKPIDFYLKYIDIKPYLLNKSYEEFISSKTSLWNYYDNYVKNSILTIQYKSRFLSPKIYKVLLPKILTDTILIPQRQRKKHPILLSFKKYFSNYFSSDILKLFSNISNIAMNNRIEVYLVGGIPRDLLIARLNAKSKIAIEELDFVISKGNAIDFSKILNEQLKGKLYFYEDFHTATIKLNNISLDFATARSEIYTKQGGLPKVEHTDLYNDLKRRDFTINAIAISLNKKSFGHIIDYFGGQLDIRKGYLRILHQKSFFDDPTRVLRMIRFKNTLNFKIQAKTEKLLQFSLNFGIFQSVKGVRLTRELSQLFQNDPLKSIEELIHYNLLFELFGIENIDLLRIRLLNSSINWLQILKPELHIKKYLIIFGYIFRLSKNMNSDLFIFKKREQQITKEIMSVKIPKFLSASSRYTTFYKYFGKLSIETMLFIIVEIKENMREHYIKFLLKLIQTKPLLTGGEIFKMGIKGVKIGQTLEKLKRLQLEGKITSKDDAKNYIKRLLNGI